MEKRTPNKAQHCKRSTSVDVAKLARVSQSTVSRVFSGVSTVSPEIRQRVLEASNQLGYRPNALARSLISKRTSLIALLVMRNESPFYHHMIDYVIDEAQRRKYNVIIVRQRDNESGADLISHALEYRVDGVIVTAIEDSKIAREVCVESDTPIVLLNRYIAGVDADVVCCDNYAAGVMIANYLNKKGHRKIACLIGDERALITRDRILGIKDQCEALALNLVDIKYGAFTYNSGREMCLEMMETLDTMPDAIFCGADVIAFGVIDTLRNNFGLRVPEDISVVGFNDIKEARWKAYDLTTVRQPFQDLASSSLDLLIRRIKTPDAPAMKIQHNCSIVERGTVLDRSSGAK